MECLTFLNVEAPRTTIQTLPIHLCDIVSFAYYLLCCYLVCDICLQGCCSHWVCHVCKLLAKIVTENLPPTLSKSTVRYSKYVLRTYSSAEPEVHRHLLTSQEQFRKRISMCSRRAGSALLQSATSHKKASVGNIIMVFTADPCDWTCIPTPYLETSRG